ncbi:MAG: hypothetical protein ACYSTL_00510 [Planctomycetota bacterium]|jgi:hypothetical protein
MAEIGSQIHAVVEDKVGKLAEVTDKITDAGVNILAAVAWVQDGKGHLEMVTSDNNAACDAVAPLADTCTSEEIVHLTLPNEVGALNKISHTLAEAGISITMLYAAAAGGSAMVVLRTSDNARAAELI